MDNALLVGKVTAGLPALSPQLRSRVDTVRRTRAMNRQALLDTLERESYAADSGGLGGNDLEYQIGRPLTAAQFEQRIRRCNPNLLVERSRADPTKRGVYRVEDGERRFICGMESGYMPEFSVRHIEMQEIPDPDIAGHWQKIPKFKGETRGWRTVLARLLRHRVIEPAAIERWFEISQGRSSRNWQLLTT